MSETKIEGKVARILNDREVVLNRGSSHGIEVGMYAAIVDLSGEEIRDPDTDEILGGLMRFKKTLMVSQVSEKFCIASTFRTKRVNVGGKGLFGSSQFDSLFDPPKYEKQVERLRLSESDPQPLDESESAVTSGDPFEIISETRARAGATATAWEPIDPKSSDQNVDR